MWGFGAVAVAVATPAAETIMAAQAMDRDGFIIGVGSRRQEGLVAGWGRDGVFFWGGISSIGTNQSSSKAH